ncbi:MAG: formate transporter FocA [Anaerolineae bacterium]|nr:MAG: formate transporter FocA [Anaerolineae bacterium]
MDSANVPIVNLDSLMPQDIALKAEAVGVAKANLGYRRLLVLGILAGAFIGMGAIFATTVATGSSALPYGVARLLIGLVFSLGLILVIVGGAELFTGNNLIVMAWASGRVPTRLLLRNWLWVYVGNFIGSVGTAALVFLSGQYKFGGAAVGTTALNIAAGKVRLDFVEALVLGILCNALVCLAVWLTMGGRTTTDKILAILFPISAFVAAGFEHSIANMYFIPVGILIKDFAPPKFWTTAGLDALNYADLTWGAFFMNNLLPVTIGNIIGGAVLVGVVYWAVYLRKRPK